MTRLELPFTMERMAANDLGTRIRRARERRGWTQQDLADELARLRGRSVGVRSVGGWERGETEPRNTLGALEELLGDLSSDGQAHAYLHPDEARIWSWTEYTEDERRAMIGALREARQSARKSS